MNKQTSILSFMIAALLFTSAVAISKSTISKLDNQNKAFTQQIKNLQSRMITLSSTMQSMTTYNQAIEASKSDNNLSNSILLLNNKLAKQDKRITMLNEDIESALIYLKRMDSANLITSNAPQTDNQHDKQLANQHKRMDDTSLKVKQAEIQAQHYAEFQNEIVDPAWADTKQNQLMTVFDLKNELAGANLTASQCRAAACEISWTIDNDLDDFERFELENNILVELARLGLDSAIGVNSTGSPNSENKVIAKSSKRLISQK